jgi:hypothetical protein
MYPTTTRICLGRISDETPLPVKKDEQDRGRDKVLPRMGTVPQDAVPFPMWMLHD